MNGAYRGTDEVGALMQDFRCDDYRDIRNPKIRARVKYFKEETEGVAAMCKTMQVIVDQEREDAEVAKESALRSISGRTESMIWIRSPRPPNFR